MIKKAVILKPLLILVLCIVALVVGTFAYLVYDVVQEAKQTREICTIDEKMETPYGVMKLESCYMEKGTGIRGGSIPTLSWNNIVILKKSGTAAHSTSDLKRNIIVIGFSTDPKLPCRSHQLLFDGGATPPKMFEFGIWQRCASLHWSSWGKKNAVIALEKNVKFKYENGKLTPPDDDDDNVRAVPYYSHNVPEAEAMDYPGGWVREIKLDELKK